jgi:SAM-dependent methyltransferase
MCRLALHHFAEPAAEVTEMARVTRGSGTLAVVDLLSPDDENLAARYNAFERMRDPSHTRAVTAGEVRDLLSAAGRPVDHWSARDVEVDVDPWFDLTRTPVSTRRTITLALERELDGGPSTGMRPRSREGRLSFVQTWALAQAGPRDRPARA